MSPKIKRNMFSIQKHIDNEKCEAWLLYLTRLGRHQLSNLVTGGMLVWESQTQVSRLVISRKHPH
jgi:hypothetical protein